LATTIARTSAVLVRRGVRFRVFFFVTIIRIGSFAWKVELARELEKKTIAKQIECKKRMREKHKTKEKQQRMST
jgi:uncharacterized ion transporter superfamily protein YfcC